MPWAPVGRVGLGDVVLLELQAHRRGLHRDDVSSRPPPSSRAILISGFALGRGGLLVDDQDRDRLLGLVLGEGRRAPDRRGDAQAADVGSLPGSLVDLPGQHRLAAVDEDLGVRDARAGEDVGGPSFDVVALETGRARDGRAENASGRQRRPPGKSAWMNAPVECGDRGPYRRWAVVELCRPGSPQVKGR